MYEINEMRYQKNILATLCLLN